MIDYKAIADYCESKNWTDYETAFAAMSVETETVDKNFPSSDIKRYLMLVDKWMPLKASTDDAALVALEALNMFETFQFADEDFGPLVKAKVSAICDALVTAGLISASDKMVIISFGDETKPVWPRLAAGNVLTALNKRARGEC